MSKRRGGRRRRSRWRGGGSGWGKRRRRRIAQFQGSPVADLRTCAENNSISDYNIFNSAQHINLDNFTNSR